VWAQARGGSSPLIRILISGGFGARRRLGESLRRSNGRSATPRPGSTLAHERGFHGRDEKTGGGPRSESPRATSPEPHGSASGFSLGLWLRARRAISPRRRARLRRRASLRRGLSHNFSGGRCRAGLRGVTGARADRPLPPQAAHRRLQALARAARAPPNKDAFQERMMRSAMADSYDVGSSRAGTRPGIERDANA
jgi:hypothetical protein